MLLLRNPSISRESTCCFAGHRPDRLPSGWRQDPTALAPLTAALDQSIGQAVKDGSRLFLTGMALGVDMLAARLVLHRRDRGEPVSLGAVLPCPRQESRWNPEDQRRYRSLLEQADWVTLVSSRYTASCMGQRNLWMVQHSSRMIAVFDGGPGGTANAVDHARRQGISLTVLDPFRPPEANETLSRDFFALHQ